jgi:hypothetical protein
MTFFHYNRTVNRNHKSGSNTNKQKNQLSDEKLQGVVMLRHANKKISCLRLERIYSFRKARFFLLHLIF